MSHSINFISLGCPKALVDSERILTELRRDGYDVVSDQKAADLVIVNTCGFIDAAIDESLQTIDEALDENGRVIVTGCLGVKAEQLRTRFPGVLDVSGPQATEAVVAAVRRHLPRDRTHDPFVDLLPPQGIKLTPRHYAYLKISEGCNHDCSFCIIPSLRGKLVSRTAAEVLAEAEQLVEAGVRELLVISQDTSAYGSDLRYVTSFHGSRPVKSRFQDLCEALSELGIWVRLHYVYPYPHVDKVIPLMGETLLPYLDIPFQHANTRILQAMRRPAASERTLERIQQWRSVQPELTIRSTFIVGFPGETEADFEELLQFLRAAELDRVGCFTYSPVDGAAANALPDPVPEAVKEERFAALMDVQREISARRLRARVGRREVVLVDEVEDDLVIARSRADAPEIDGLVYLQRDDYDVEPGDFIEADIIGAEAHDLNARIVGED